MDFNLAKRPGDAVDVEASKKPKTDDIRHTTATEVVPTTVLDPDGDLFIIAGGELTNAIRRFKVCSATMRRASPFFKKLLFGKFSEGKAISVPGKDWVVEMPLDEPDVLEILLQLIHAIRLPEIPTPPPILTLRDIVTLVDKYDLFHIVQPWASGWLNGVMNQITDTTQMFDLIYANWIAWKMGNPFLFDVTANTIAAQTFRASDGYIEDTDGFSLRNTYNFVHLNEAEVGGPGSMLSLIADRRIEFLQEYLDFFYRCLNPGRSGSCKKHPTGTTDEALRCTACTVGEMFLKMMHSNNGNTIGKDASLFLGNLDKLVSLIASVVKVEGRYHGQACTYANKFTDFDLHFKQTFKNRSFASDAHKKTMAYNRKRYRLEDQLDKWAPPVPSLPQQNKPLSSVSNSAQVNNQQPETTSLFGSTRSSSNSQSLFSPAPSLVAADTFGTQQRERNVDIFGRPLNASGNPAPIRNLFGPS